MVNPNREYRAMPLMTARAEEGETYRVEGYATTWEPYVMFSVDGVDYKERIMPEAFETADMTDVILQYDHQGRVYARMSNGTLAVRVDEHGLHVSADLSRTANARNLYEDIAAGMITKMSWAFTVAEDYFDAATNTRVITKVAKIYDTSCVSIPANPGTDIKARAYFDGVIEKAREEFARAEARQRARKQKAERRRKLLLALELEKELNHEH